MVASLRSMAYQVMPASTEVNAAAAQLSASSEQLAATTTEQSAAVTEVSATTQELAWAAGSIARVSAAIRMKRLQDELRQRNVDLHEISRTDALTRVHNRRHAEELLSDYGPAGRHSQRGLAVLMFDLDHFKSVNDTFGHAGGGTRSCENSQYGCATRCAATTSPPAGAVRNSWCFCREPG
jgi:PleD family two-component response regulator